MRRAGNSGADAQAAVSWVLYDGGCAKCTALAKRFRRALRCRGYVTAPLQSLWVPAALHMTPAHLLEEMRVLTARGEVFGGADALLHLAREFWWAQPLVWFSNLPRARWLLHSAYRWLAAHRHCSSTGCTREVRNVAGD